MRVLYVAKHGCGDNDDEGAIAHALTQLGCEVLCVQEGARQPYPDADMCLFHKWAREGDLASLRMPKVFWYFDLVDGRYDPTLASRSESRLRWMKKVLPHVDLGFCTDGDWVAADGTGKLRWLMQGADERHAYMLDRPKTIDVLFTGMVNHGRERAEHIAELKEQYNLTVFGNAGPKRRVHGYELAELLASAKVVVAPDGPNSDRYWSNRVYLTLGLGGFLLHPLCEKLREQFAPNELKQYSDRYALRLLLDYYLTHPEDCEAMRRSGHEAVMRKHTYRHRCEELLCVFGSRTSTQRHTGFQSGRAN